MELMKEIEILLDIYKSKQSKSKQSDSISSLATTPTFLLNLHILNQKGVSILKNTHMDL